MIQSYDLSDEDYRGERFKDHPGELKGNNDLLSITQPGIIGDIHEAYDGGRLRHHRDEHLLIDLHRPERLRNGEPGLRAQLRGRPHSPRGGGRLYGQYAVQTPFRGRGARADEPTASLSPDVNNPGFRNVTFDELKEAYGEEARGLVEGGVDLLLIETIFDTLNAKAAIFACRSTWTRRVSR
jgi:5-methyltetrahydrofolate--homocysteine methyltransferase